MILKTIRQSWIFTTIQIKVCQSNGKWICQQNLKHIPKESCIISDFYILARALPILGVGLLLSSVRRYSEKLLFVCHPAKLNTIHKYNQPIQAQQIMQEENYHSAEYHVLAL